MLGKLLTVFCIINFSDDKRSISLVVNHRLFSILCIRKVHMSRLLWFNGHAR